MVRRRAPDHDPVRLHRGALLRPRPALPGDEGFHHGLDIAIPCGTKLYAGKRAKVVDNATLGSAYGANPVLLRNRKLGWDLVIGHTRKVFVEPGDTVHRGDVFALASDSGAPDGCHLHFEQRAVEGGLDTAVWPRPLLGLAGEERDMNPEKTQPAGAPQLHRGRRPAAHDPEQARQAARRARSAGPGVRPGQTYPEAEVNDMLQRFHPDYAALRRYLVENDFLTREEGRTGAAAGPSTSDDHRDPRRGLVRRGARQRRPDRVQVHRGRPHRGPHGGATFEGVPSTAAASTPRCTRRRPSSAALRRHQLLRRHPRRLQAHRLGVRRLHAASRSRCAAVCGAA